MKIALIHCPFDHRSFSENLKVVDEEFCLAPPIVLAYVAAILEKAGHRVLLIDANALKLSKEKVLEMVNAFVPDILGFRVDSYWFHRVVEWATFFKERIRLPIIVGGINVTLFPNESLSHRCFDFGLAGEANEALPLLLQCMESGGSFEMVPGLVYRRDGQVICNPPSEKMVDFNDYPFPARHLLPNHLYSSFTSQRKNFTIMVTNMGCPFPCTFCAINRQRFRCRSPKNVVDEIEQCYREYGVREIDFFSPSFFANKSIAREICNEIVRRNIKIEWSCRSRVDQVDKEVLSSAYRAGCRKIYYGIESVSVDVLGRIAKGISIEQVQEAIALTRASKIKTLGFFMVGNPGDTRESILATVEFAKRLELDYVQVCRVVAKPNTELDDFVIKNTGKDHWRDYILDGDVKVRFPSPWTSLTAEELDSYVTFFYRSFYFRPLYLIRRIGDIKSINELFRYAKVLFKWLSADRK